MSIDMKNKIRPIYSEFQGYLSQAPTAASSTDSISDETMWNQYNEALKLLSDTTEKDYSRFKIEPKSLKNSPGSYVRVDTYRQKISGLISNLHGDFFQMKLPLSVVCQVL